MAKVPLPKWLQSTRSPKKVQTLITGYLGPLGTYLLYAADRVMRVVSDYPVEPMPHYYDRLVVRRFVGRKVARRTVYLNQFYEMLNEVDELHNSILRLQSNGEIERARDLIRKHGPQLAVRDSLHKINLQIGKLNRSMVLVRRNKYLSREEKRDRIDRLQKTKNRLATVSERLKPIYERKQR
jgi:hypothetical protein